MVSAPRQTKPKSERAAKVAQVKLLVKLLVKFLVQLLLRICSVYGKIPEKIGKEPLEL
jgi:hypothetical protein